MSCEERKEESMPPLFLREMHSNTAPQDVRGTVIYYTDRQFLVCNFFLRNFERTFTINRCCRNKMKLDVKHNIFEAIERIHPGTEIKGLDEWTSIRINYLYYDEFFVEGVLRNIFLTKFCELNKIELDL